LKLIFSACLLPLFLAFNDSFWEANTELPLKAISLATFSYSDSQQALTADGEPLTAIKGDE
jgi:hypothetical protein